MVHLLPVSPEESIKMVKNRPREIDLVGETGGM
jgi:hypothetical protein